MSSGRYVLFFGLICSAPILWGQEKEKDNAFLRLRRDSNKQITSLDLAVGRYFIPTRALPKVNPRTNVAANDGRTALHVAAEKGYLDIVKKLLEEGADPDGKTTDGSTPLLLAAKGGHKEVVDWLLKAQKAAAKIARPAAGEVTIDLVSAVHVGDEAYYDRLNDRFEEYDVVLYELVAPKNSIPKREKPRGDNPLHFLQSAVTDVLELEHQLDGVDYKQDNFVHADMSPEEVFKSMEKRGESVMKLLLRAMAADVPEQQEVKGIPEDMDQLLAMVLSPDRAVKMKRIVAAGFENMDSQMAILFPRGSTVITERNKVAL
ncbi:MAG: ankyrin repeat domain-containing protein, partial [Planctomycetales bacterium]